MEKKPKNYKIVFIGDTNVGKSSIISRLHFNRFTPYVNSTIGAGYISHNLDNYDPPIQLNIWDTAGQERFRSLVSIYYRNVDLCVITFDLSKFDKEQIDYWIREFKSKTINHDTPIVILGNKYDLINIEDEIYPYADEYINSLGYDYYKVSALNGYNIIETFNKIGEKLAEEIPIIENNEIIVIKEAPNDNEKYVDKCLSYTCKN